MRQSFIKKHIGNEPKVKTAQFGHKNPAVRAKEVEMVPVTKNNKSKKKEKTMNFDEIEKLANELTPEQTTKVIKKDKGLIERVESSKIMITEDNKQLLKD